tara:strand:+ start:292 stop:957 length:666 start_codon:yes stop_codon:yes gene_type:complete
MNLLTQVNDFEQDYVRQSILAWRNNDDELPRLGYYRPKIMSQLGLRYFEMPHENPYLQSVVFKPTKRYDTWGILFMGNKKLRKIVRVMQHETGTFRRLLNIDYWDDDYLFSGSPDRDTFRSHLNWAGHKSFIKHGWVFINPRKPFSQEMIDEFVNNCLTSMSEVCHQWYARQSYNIQEQFKLFDEIAKRVRADRSFWSEIYYDAEQSLDTLDTDAPARRIR